MVSCKSKETTTVLVKDTSPNIIIIYTDDQGYQDLGIYGSPKIKTPHLDALANTGIRFTDFYVTTSVCSASRASLLTGRYPFNNGVGGVFFPDSKGMNPNEVTIAEMLKTMGYNTGCFGKWHLGDLDGHLPTNQGFDEYYGIPYSNDMYIGYNQKFSKDVVFRNDYTLEKAKEDQQFVKNNSRQKLKEKGLRDLVPLFNNEEIIEYPCDQSTLTKRYFETAIDFIDKSEGKPFLAYITPSMPHVPLFASKAFEGKSQRGLYGDVIEEIDWYVGKLISHLKGKGIYENTMIIFASDNGPWLAYKDHAGSADPLRDGKFTNYEGGVRVPCIMNWPNKWQSGKTTSKIVSTVDIMPTIAYYTGAELPNKTIDGINISNILENTKSDNTQEILYYTRNSKIMGVRKGNWKYLPFSGKRFADSTKIPELFNLKNDISEKNNVYSLHPEIIQELTQILINKQESLK